MNGLRLCTDWQEDEEDGGAESELEDEMEDEVIRVRPQHHHDHWITGRWPASQLPADIFREAGVSMEDKVIPWRVLWTACGIVRQL